MGWIRRTLLLSTFAALLALAAACAPNGADVSEGGAPPQGAGGGSTSSGGNGGRGPTDDLFASNQVQPGAPTERLIIRNGEAVLFVADVTASEQAVRDLAAELGGYVVSSNRYGQEESAYATITIRVPAQTFDSALERLRAVAERVDRVTTTSQDVTEEFVDLEARLRTLQATEQRLIELLGRAQTVDEILKIEQQLSTVRTDIERIQGRMEYLSTNAALSTIAVTLQPVANPAPLVNPEWGVEETVREAFRSLVVSFQGIATLAIWTAIFTPFWLPFVVFLVWAIRRSNRIRATAMPPGPGATGS
jgi:hypothetical protein